MSDIDDLVAGARRDQVEQPREAATTRPAPAPAKGRERYVMPGPEDDRRAAAFLRGIRARVRLPEGVGFARLVGNELQAETTSELECDPPLGELETIAERIGKGAVYLQPVPGSQLGILQLGASAGYRAVRLFTDAGREPLDTVVIARGMPFQPRGILAYASGTMVLPELTVTGRTPRDPKAIALSIAADIDHIGTSNRGPLAWLILSRLRGDFDTDKARRGEGYLSPAEVMAVLERLRRAGRLADFLSLASRPEMRAYLQGREVDWAYVVANWQPGFQDRGLLWSGFMIGAGQNVSDCVIFLGTVAGGAINAVYESATGEVLDARLAQHWKGLAEGMKAFFSDPVVMSVKAMGQFADAVENAAWELDMFELGRLLGNAVVMLLTLPEALAQLPKAARALAKTAVKVVDAGAALLRRLGIGLRELFERIAEGARAFELQGYQFALAEGDTLLMMSSAGEPTRAFAMSQVIREVRTAAGKGHAPPRGQKNPFADLTDAEIDAALAALDEPAPASAPPKKKGRDAREGTRGKLPRDLGGIQRELELLVSDGIAEARRRLGRQFLPPRDYGTLLHGILKDLQAKYWADSGEFVFHVEKHIDDFAHVPGEVKNMTVADFLEVHPEYNLAKGPLEKIFGSLDKRIGDMRPDLVVEHPRGLRMVWDLTGKLNQEHLAKTLFYVAVLDDGKAFCRISETYWRQFRPGFKPEKLYPAAAAAHGEAQAFAQERVRQSVEGEE